MALKKEVTDFMYSLQTEICEGLEKLDGKALFGKDQWEREGGGGGTTRIIEKGGLIEKGGVNVSAVWGQLPEQICKAWNIESSEFYATGLSIVLHPCNPFVPIIHMNIRYFSMEEGTQWFGGGIDLTPHYVFEEDAKFFHRKLKSVCDEFDPEYYKRFKKWADDYFYIPHRNEMRGVGGIFFDRLTNEEGPITKKWHFVQNVGKSFLPSYSRMSKRNDLNFGVSERKWQLHRRSRYVEFNLVYDKGTQFGLQTSGRIESILMSLPPLASWEYDFQPDKNSKEASSVEFFKKGIDWI